MSEELERLLLAAPGASADLEAQLLWLESLAIATSSAKELGDAGAHAAVDLRAALGAFIQFASGPQGPSEQLSLSVTVQALLPRALAAIYGALAAVYKELAAAGPHERECRELARLWGEAQRSVLRGTPISPQTIGRLDALRAKILDVDP